MHAWPSPISRQCPSHSMQAPLAITDHPEHYCLGRRDGHAARREGRAGLDDCLHRHRPAWYRRPHRRDRPVNPPIMPGWDCIDVPGILHQLLGAPVVVDNDVNVMASASTARCARMCRICCSSKVATGTRAGVVMDSELRRGAQGAAGDIGHIAVPGAAETPCRCGNTGCLEAVAGGGAIADVLRRGGARIDTTQDIVDLVRAGDIARGPGCSSGGPRHRGGAGRNGEHAEPVADHRRRHALRRRRTPHRRHQGGRLPALAPAGDPAPADHDVARGAQAGVVGAATLVTDRFLAPHSIDALITVKEDM